jgi:SAM-dependent methyltransferase
MARSGYLGALALRLWRSPRPPASVDADGATDGSFRATHALPEFLSELRGRQAPVVVDLGPAIGKNVSFLAEEFACKLVIEDLLARTPGRTSSAGNGAGDSDGWAPRLPHPDESVDGVLCWDVLDHLPRSARDALAGQLARMLRPGGVLLMCHRVDAEMRPERVVHEIVGPDRLCLQRVGDAPAPLDRPLQLRELESMFGELTVLKAVLLKSRVREVLFRKAGPAAVSV